MRELRVRAPVVAALPAQLLPLHPEPSGDQDRTRLVEQPVRLRLPQSEWCGRVEAIDHAMAIEEQQPILRPTPRREEQQLKLIGGQELLLEQHVSDLTVTFGQVPGQLEHSLRAHPHRPRLPRRRRR
jgi:hypothetical protein